MRATSVRRHGASTIVFITIAAVLLVPPFIRATQRIAAGASDSTPIRLNRGFDRPEAKQTVTPSVGIVRVVAHPDEPGQPEFRRLDRRDEIGPVLAPPTPLDPLRGPPAC